MLADGWSPSRCTRHCAGCTGVDLAGWVRNDGKESSAPFTTYSNGQANKYWPEVSASANGVVRKADLKIHPEAGPDASGAIAQHRDVWLAETRSFVSTPIYARERLRPGNHFAGPAIVEQMDATTLVPPGMTARVDAYLNLILESAA